MKAKLPEHFSPLQAMSVDNDLIAAAIRHHETGQFALARELYSQALASDPDNADVLSLLGAVCINLHDWPQAAAYLNDALRVNPQHAAAHDNLGVLLAQQNRMAEAAESFRRAAALYPHNARTWRNLARALTRAGRPTEAIEPLRRVAELDPSNARAHAELAKALVELGRTAETIEPVRQVARLQPHDPRSQFELAEALARAGKTEEAIAAYQDVLRLKSDSVEALVNLAQLHIARRAYDEAVEYARRAIALRAGFAEAHLNLGVALTKQGKLAEAVAVLCEAARLNPQLSEAHNNLGIALAEQGNFSEAADRYRRALEVRPQNPDVLYNYGIVVLKQGDPITAIEWFDRAIALAPNYGEAHHNRAAALLLSGQMVEGFAEYEWRFRSRDFAPFRPRWRVWNGEPIEGRTIVLCAEQGLGDTLQFVRYAATLKDGGARVIVACPQALHAVLARTPGIDTWISPEDTAPEADFCMPLLSLPHRMGTTVETIPADVPYVFAEPVLVDSWRAKLADYHGLRIGIAWQGNPKCPGDAQRSIPLADYAVLAAVPNVRLFSLQRGPGSEQLDAVRDAWPVVDFGDALDRETGAFMDTAAIMKNLDLVVTSDTATAHLAGAMGVSVWVALPFVPDWRWLMDRTDSPWYPTMRLVRQNWPGNWQGVFERIAADVARLAVR